MNIDIEKIMAFIFLFLFLIMSLWVIRMVLISPSIVEICKEKYGEEYVKYIDENFGEVCVTLDYENFKIKNGKPFPTKKELREICGIPDFFDFKKWKSERCNGE
jgi:hypothetical protein